MKGDLLTASFDNIIYRIKLNASGTAVLSKTALFSNVGAVPLDVTALGTGPLAGTVWAVDYILNQVFVFEPNDFSGGGGGGSGADDPTLDEDGDGYNNHDEIVNGTSFSLPAPLPEDTMFFWRVSVTNCSNATSDVFRFVTAAPTSYCRTPNLPIPDSPAPGVNDNLVIADVGTIADLDVTLDVSHTWVGDLAFSLSNGTTTRVFSSARPTARRPARPSRSSCGPSRPRGSRSTRRSPGGGSSCWRTCPIPAGGWRSTANRRRSCVSIA